MPERVPGWLERAAAASLKAEPGDIRLGDLAEDYVRTCARTRSRLAANLHYLFAAANVVFFARAIDPVLRAAESATMPVVAIGLHERTMTTLLAAIDLGERAMANLRLTFGKLVLPGLLIAGCALLVSSALDIWSTWRRTETLMTKLQLAKAESAANRIEQTLVAIQGQIALTADQLPSTSQLEQRRFDFLRLLRQVPAIIEIAWLDANGMEELWISRLARDRIGSGADFAGDKRYVEAQKRGTYYGPVSVDKGKDPHVSLAMAHPRRTSVAVAEINVKILSDAIRAVDAGEGGSVYVIDGKGRLIAHRDADLVRRQPDLSTMPQVAAALAGKSPAQSIDGRTIDAGLSGAQVVSVYAAVPTPGWRVIFDLPVTEARAPIWSGMIRAGAMLGIGLVALLLASLVAVRRTQPIHPA